MLCRKLNCKNVKKLINIIKLIKKLNILYQIWIKSWNCELSNICNYLLCQFFVNFRTTTFLIEIISIVFFWIKSGRITSSSSFTLNIYTTCTNCIYMYLQSHKYKNSYIYITLMYTVDIFYEYKYCIYNC